MNKRLLLGGAIALSMAAGNVFASVSATEAARLNKDLTPIGAERNGNGGAIPAWTGGAEAPAGFKVGAKHVDLYAGDKVKFTITAENYMQYKDSLTEGQMAMFKKYPASYRMPVYDTHRSSGYPDNVYQESIKNASNTNLVEGGNGMSNYDVGVPFPIPADGLEVIWNHIVRYRGGSVSRVID